MIASQDDGLGHGSADHFTTDGQQVTTPAIADTPHAMFTERYWYMGALVPEGDFVFGAGLGYYANRKVMDGYVSVSRGGRQYSFSASRQCAVDPLVSAIGAMRITVEEGLKAHRIQLGANASGLALDLRFNAAMAPNDEGRDKVVRGGQLMADVSRYIQFGHYTGWVELEGSRTEVAGTQCWGARDRSWGLRTEARTDASSPPLTRFRPMMFLWVCAQFEGHGIHLFLKEDAPGQVRSLVANESYPPHAGRPASEIVEVEHDIEWQEDPFAQRIAGGTLRLRFADGRRKILRMRALPGWLSLKAGMYGGYRGWFQGDDKGPLHTATQAWNLADPGTRRELRTLAEQVIEFSDGDAVGYGTIQGGVAEGFAKYPEVQQQPMM
ncbi:hypothetical protein SRS16P2_00198 (plasmid) [Variovorax sp. SRS16]|uniref:hypothetical protein n=1 Tax=Variovorax sp. SRS16 TaxID=282217 RepID=UPI0013199372|nr:hypothetical protein [Variovorax sp. SRS16]VTU45537.1 hypothetical protein SRS16P2_00198 [Variovorax sp. SRS16]